MTKRLAIGVLLLCLPLFLGCSGRREVAAVPLVIREEVPAYLTEPTPAPVLAGDTNLDLVGHVFDWQAALGACNADKAAIRPQPGRNDDAAARPAGGACLLHAKPAGPVA